jgi:hypothetical protein
MNRREETQTQARTGVPVLDDILAGGLQRNRLFLLEGSPGTGKTTIGLKFLLEGRDRDELGLYITLSETTEELLGTCGPTAKVPRSTECSWGSWQALQKCQAFVATTSAMPGTMRDQIGLAGLSPASFCQACISSMDHVPDELVAAK